MAVQPYSLTLKAIACHRRYLDLAKTNEVPTQTVARTDDGLGKIPRVSQEPV
jgi:hypothetical protein